MLFQVLRKNMKTLLVGIIIIVIFTFLFWGPGMIGEPREYAGQIFGKNISMEKYYNSIFSTEIESRLLYGEQFERFRRFLNIEERAWERLILLREARRQGIRVTDKEVIRQIEGFPFFRDEQGFNQNRYQQFLQFVLQITPRTFESIIKESLLLEKLRERIVAGITVSDEEVREEFTRRTQKIKAIFVVADKELFRQKVSATEEEILKYYNKHREEFTMPEQVRVDYIGITKQDMQAKVKISDESIENFYKKYREEFKKKNTQNVSEDISQEKKNEYKPLEEVKEEIRQRLTQAEALRLVEYIADKISIELIEKEESATVELKAKILDEIAKKYNLQIKESPFFTRDGQIQDIGYSEQIGDVAFSLGKNQVSDIIRTNSGSYFIRLKDRKTEYIQPVEEVKDRVKNIIIKEKTGNLSKQTVEELLNKFKSNVFNGENIDNMAKELSVKILRPEPFVRQGYIEGIGQAAGQILDIFNLKKSELSSILRLEKGYGFAYIEGIIDANSEEFEKTKDKYYSFIFMKKRQEKFADWFEKLKKQAQRSALILPVVP